MNKEIVNVLKKIESNNFEAYVIGGYVRDKLLGIETYDIDIATNALPKDIMSIFNIKSVTNYGTAKISTDNYRFDIATYRKELSYSNRNPEVKYINSLNEDIVRRDFTINTIAMNKDGEIVDYLNGVKDLQNRLIRCVGDPTQKIKEDPLRILRALRFSIILDFKLEDNLINAIKKNIDLVKTLSSNRIKEEFDKILVNNNALNGFDYLNKLGILKLLNISYDKLIDVDDLSGMYAQIKVADDYPFTKEERNNIESIKKIVDYGKIDNNILFNYDLYISMVAARILGLDKEEIIRMYNELPIKSFKDVAINNDDILKVLNIEPSEVVKKINDRLINKILAGELINEKSILLDYVREMYNNEL